jgi:paraquat-inducible protein B
MSKRASPTLVGGFIVGGVALAVGAVVAFGSGKLFKDTVEYISWFQGSVNGLNPGAPVKFLGVTIGEVTAIRLRAAGDDALDTPDEFRDWETNLRIPVFYELDRDLLRKEGSVVDVGDREVARLLVESGMRATLAVESILTGRKYIALSVDRDSPMELIADPNVHAFEVPTKETGLEWLERDVQGLMNKLTNLDVEGLVESIKGAANNIGDLASRTETREALADIPGTLAEVRETLRAIQALAASADTTLDTVRPRIDASSAEIEAAAEELDLMLRNLRAVIEPGSPLLTNLETALYEISIAAAALGELADYLQQNPSALLRGKDLEGN